MQRSMLEVVDELLGTVKVKTKSISNTRKFYSIFKDLRSSYQCLDDATKSRVDKHLQANHAKFLGVLQKRGSQLPEIPDLVSMVDDTLLTELSKILKSAPQAASANTHAEVHRRMSSQELPDTGTFKFMPDSSGDSNSPLRNVQDQLRLAIDSPNLKRVSKDYLARASYGTIKNPRKEDSLTIIINVFEILQRNKEKMAVLASKNELTQSYVEANERAVLKQMEILQNKLHIETLGQLATDLTDYSQLRTIHQVLSAEQGDKDNQLITGMMISKLIDNMLIAVLQKRKMNIDDKSHAMSNRM